MTNEELIEMFREDIFPMQAEHLSRLNFEGEGQLDKIEYLRDTDSLLKLARKGLESEWIPVSERLPDHNGTYLTTMKYTGKSTGTIYIDLEETFFDIARGFNVGVNEEVLAWMPLPEPYKAEGSE